MKIAAVKMGNMGDTTPNKVSAQILEVPEVCIKAEEIFKEEFGVTHLAAELLGNKKHSEEAYVEELFGEAHDSSESEEQFCGKEEC